ncbi:MAG: InlB B-repeat-containing protein [Paludibacteraceae bacterium]|nr:InlB B-repeat-containing protein [Paludibacteraceae bacterium]
MMTNLLHGAHVANKLFSTIARLRLLLVMFVALSVSANAWGENIFDKLYLSAKNTPQNSSNWTFTDATCNNANSDYWKMVKNTSVVTSPEFDISGYTNVTVEIKWQNFGTFDESKSNATIKVSTAKGIWTPIGTTGLSEKGTITETFENVEVLSSYKQAQIQISTPDADGSNGGRLIHVIITGDVSSSGETPDSYTVNWYVNGEVEYSQTDIAGTALTGIPVPTTLDCDGEREFVGWTTQSSYEHATNAPTDLITNTSGLTMPENGEDYYAVFATRRDDSGSLEEVFYTNTGKEGTDQTTSIVASGNINTKNGNGETNCIGLTSATNKTFTFSNINTSNYSTVTLQFDHKIGKFTNYPTLTISCGDFEKTIQGSTGKYITAIYDDFPIGKNLTLTFTISAASGNNYSQTYLDNISLIGYKATTTYSDYTTQCTTQPTPSLIANPTSLEFGNVATDSNKEMDFTLTGSNLTANASLQLSGINPGMFSLSSNSVTQSDGTINQTITVTYTPTATGSHNATLTISSTGAESETVTLSGTGVAPAAKYTVTFHAGSGTCDDESLTETSGGAGVTLPTANPPAACATDGWEFAGWWTAEVGATTTSPGELLTAGSNYKPTNNRTLYAVYSYTEAGGGGGGSEYTQLAWGTPINAGKYLISTGETTITGQDGNKTSQLAVVSYSPSTNQCTEYEFTISEPNNEGYFTIKLPNNTNWVGWSSSTSSTSTALSPEKPSTDAYLWKYTSNGILNKAATDRYLQVNGTETAAKVYTTANPETNWKRTYLYSFSDGSTITYNSNPTCEASILPTWVPATISHSTIKVVCGSTTSPSATGTNGPATIIFEGSNLVNSVTVTASAGFLVSTNKTDANTYKQTITINPIASGDHEGTLDNIYIIASTSKETSEDYAGTITLEGEDITDGSQEISVTADVTCLPYTLTFNDRGSTIPATYYAGALVPEPTPPTDVCTDPINYEFDGWAMAIVEDGSVEYTKVDFSTFTMPANNNTILYAVYRYAEESTDDVCHENQFKMVRTQNEIESGADYILAGYNGTNDYAMTKTIRKNTNSYYDVLTSIKNSEYINADYIITLDNDEEDDFVWKITGDLTNGYQIYDEYSNKYLTLGEWYWDTYPREYFTRFDWEDTGTKFRININEEKNGAAYISYTNNHTWYFGFMYYINQPDQRIIRGTTDETYIYLYKRCSGIKYLYTTTPDCDSDCTPATDITYTTEGTSITLSWTATEPSATIILYADKNATSPVKEINDATSPYTINGLAETTTYYAQIVTNEDCTSAITEVSTERPYVEIVEWDTDHLNAYINTNEDITITLENEVQKGTPTSRVATELFFSKYFEATGNVKLLALYNGTEKAIDLTSYKIKLSVLGASSLTDKNESTDIDYAQTINLGTDILPTEKRTLPAGKELILIAYANSSADDAVIFMNPDGTQNTIDKNDAAILTCAANSTKSGWNEYIRISTGKLNFSGNDAVALFKGETLIDIIGAGDATDADVQNLSPKTDFMDAPGWYNTEGYQIQPDGTIGATKNYALSTNRCLLIRRNSVTSGENAVTKNTTDFITLGGEYCEWMGHQIPDKASACEGFEYVGGYDFSSYYSSYEELSSDYYSPATRNSDGTYTVNVNLTPHACKRLMITIKNHTTQQVMAVQEYKVPIIIDTDHTTTGEKFTDLKNNLGTIIVDQNGTPTGDITPLTDEEWKDACKECDVVVRDNATLSHESGGINQFRDMTIYPTGKLDNGYSQAITLNSLQMQSMNNEIPYAIINNDGSTIDVGNMVFIKRMDDKYWYQFSLPYDCKISDIRQLNGQSMGKYWVDWGIKEYNGKRRQTEGTAATEGQVSQYWEKVEENATLKAHHGYIIGLFTHKWASVYFTPSTTNPYRESGNDAKTTTVESWYTTNLATLAPRHHGWNFTGSPYITQFGQVNAGQGMNNILLMKGEINQGSIDQGYINTENVYVTIPDLPDGLTYTQAIASTTTIKPFTAYFVQTTDVTGNSDATRTLTYDKTGRSLPSSAPARAAATKQRVLVELNITAPDGQTDNTGIWVDERYTTDYEIAADLTKMYVAGTKPQLYTLAANNEKLAYNALPDNAAAYIPLGLYAPVAGDYTLTLDERVSRVAGAETVELLYNNQLVANLLYQDYTIAANKGTVSGYSLSIRRRADVSTAVDNTTGSTITLIANDEYISLVGVPTDATISIYDMLGRLITSQQANGQSVVNMPIVPQGVYNIVVANGTGYTTIKSVIK